MFWTLNLSFVVNIFAFFGLQTIWATFLKNGQIVFKSSSRPDLCQYSNINYSFQILFKFRHLCQPKLHRCLTFTVPFNKWGLPWWLIRGTYVHRPSTLGTGLCSRPVVKVIKLFSVSLTLWQNNLECLPQASLFSFSLIFVMKAGT